MCLVMGLGSSFETTGVQFFSSDLMPRYEVSDKHNNGKYGKIALNEEIRVREWQQKVKRVKILGKTLTCILYVAKSQGSNFIKF